MSVIKFESKRHVYWNGVSDKDWNSWTWQLQNKITTLEELVEISKVDPSYKIDADDIRKTQDEFHFGITPYYFSLIDLSNKNCPIGRQSLPTSEENVKLDNESLDFPKEDTMMPVPGLTHRYPDRVMLYTTHHCAMYCRFCTRKRKVSNPTTRLNKDQIKAAVDYIERNPKIREIVLSGGDVFSYSDSQLEELIAAFRAIPHMEIIRLGVRMLATLPMRTTERLAEIFKKYQPIYIQSHFNHPAECSKEAYDACRILRSAGCVINSNTVLLKGINDDTATLRHLYRKLMMMGIQPYYAYHCDLTYGSHHFRTTIESDLREMNELRANTDWMHDIGVPHYMVDTPGGGKVELL